MFTSTKEEVASLREEMVRIQARLSPLQDTLAKEALTRIEEIRAEIVKLLDEAEEVSKDANLTFYRSTFLDGIDEGGYRYDNNPYWTSSDYC